MCLPRAWLTLFLKKSLWVNMHLTMNCMSRKICSYGFHGTTHSYLARQSRFMFKANDSLSLVVLAVMFSWMLQSDYAEMLAELGVTSWVLFQENGVVHETLAGTWFLLVTSPLVSFLLYRWVWRLMVWSLFLFRVSRLDLNLYASHTDLAGGLAVIVRGQSYFGIVFVVLGTSLSWKYTL